VTLFAFAFATKSRFLRFVAACTVAGTTAYVPCRSLSLMRALPTAFGVTVKVAVPNPAVRKSTLTEAGLMVATLGSLEVAETVVNFVTVTVRVCGVGNASDKDDGDTERVAPRTSALCAARSASLCVTVFGAGADPPPPAHEIKHGSMSATTR
jgi:hypothetical protein